MKKALIMMASALLVAVTSCHKATPEGEQPSAPKDAPVFTAGIEDVKTAVNPANGKVSWDGDEEITVTDASSVSATYVIESLSSGLATFVPKAGEPTLGAGPYTAVYGAPISTAQVYAETVTDLPMEAASENTTLSFAVSCGLLELTLTSAEESISSIAVTDGTTPYTLSCPTAQSIASAKKFYNESI